MGFQFIDNQPIRFNSAKFDDQSCINKDLSAYNILMKPGDPIHWQAKLQCCENVNDACDASIEGAEMITDGDMSNPAAFVLGAGWAIAAGVATFTATGVGAAIRQTGIGTVTGRPYLVSVEVVSNDTGFGVYILLGGKRAADIPANVTGVFEFYISSGSVDNIQLQSANDYGDASSGTLVIDNLSLKPVANCYTFDNSTIEYIINGGFTTTNQPWTITFGWTYAANIVTHTTPAETNSVTQQTIIGNGRDILWSIDVGKVTPRTTGGIDIYYGNVNMQGTAANGIFSFNYPAFGLSDDTIRILPWGGFDGDIDDVSATETFSGWFYDPVGGFCHQTGWANAFYAGNTLTVGRYYKMTFEITVQDGSVVVEAGGVVLGTVDKTGVYTFYFTSLSTAGERFTPSSDFDGCILDTIDICFLFRDTLQARLVYQDGITGATDWHTVLSSSNPVILDENYVTWRINSLASILSGGVLVSLPYSCYRMQVKVVCDIADPPSVTTHTSDTVINYAATQPCTKMFMSYCEGDALDFRFGYQGNMFRIYSRLRTLYFNPSYPIDAQDYEFSSGLSQRIYATKKKKYELLFDYCDEYAHDVIALMIVCDIMIIDNVQYIADSKDYEPEWADRGKRNLAQSIIELQKSDGIIFNRNCS